MNPPREGAIDALHPWLGLASFGEETQRYFYGREEEVAELARRVQRKLLTVLFGQSGLGKTSILRAGIVPRLRAQGYCPVYLRVDYGPDAIDPAQQIKQAILQATAGVGNWSRAGVAAEGESLWEFLHHRDDLLTGADGAPLIPLLIFDQFEEIFTLAQSDDGGRARAARFIDGLAELVENRPSRELEAQLEVDDSAVERFDFARSDYRVLIALREDYLAHLEGLKAAMPSITQNRMRLAPMTGQQALAAVAGPGGALVGDEVAQAIVRFVAGGAELAHAQVEPSLLSLICRELNDKRILAQRAAITIDLLDGSHASILSDFYERALADQPDAVRAGLEDILLTDSGYRENVAEERVRAMLAKAGASAQVLPLLVNRRLLRIEERLDVRRVELTHDVLCGVVAASRAQRKEREAHAATIRDLEQQRVREQAARTSLVRARRILAGCVVLTFCAVAGGLFGYLKAREASQTRLLAEQSRANAEQLLSYLLDDFYQELQPVGRLDLLGDLGSRAVNYYQALPAEMRNAGTELNHATALLRFGMVRRLQGNSEESKTLLDQAIASLKGAAANGQASEATRLALATALEARSSTAIGMGDMVLVDQLNEEGRAVAKPLAMAPGASPAAKRVYGYGLTRHGWRLMRSGDWPAAEAVLREARELLRASGPLTADLRSAAGFIDASAWLHEAVARGPRREFALADQIADETLGAAAQLLALRPDHTGVIYNSWQVLYMRGFQARHQGRPREAQRWLAQARQLIDDLLRRDPGNARFIDGLAITQGMMALVYADLGQPADALRTTSQIWPLYARTPPNSFQCLNLNKYAMLDIQLNVELQQPDKVAEREQFIKALCFQNPPAPDDTAGLVSQLYRDWQAADLARFAAGQRAPAPRFGAAIDNIIAMPHLTAATRREAERLRMHALRLDGELAYAAADFRRAESDLGKALALTLKNVSLASDELEDLPSLRTRYAMALLRLGRDADARAQLSAAVQAQRALLEKGGGPELRLELARSLFGLGELKQAKAQLDALPQAMQAYRSVSLLRADIAGGAPGRH